MRKIQIKTPVRHHFALVTLITLTVIRGKNKMVSIGENMEKLKLTHCCWKCSMLLLFQETIFQFLKMLNIKLYIMGHSNSLLSIYTRDGNIHPQKNLCTNVHTSINNLRCTQSKCISTDK